MFLPLIKFSKLISQFDDSTHHTEVQYSWSEILKEVSFHWIVPVRWFITTRINYNIVCRYAALQMILVLLQGATIVHAALVFGILGARESVRRVAENVALAVSVSADIRNVCNAMRILHLRKLYEISRWPYKRWYRGCFTKK